MFCSVEGCKEIADLEVRLYDYYPDSNEEFNKLDSTCPYLCEAHAKENEEQAEGKKQARGRVKYPHSNQYGAQGFTTYRKLKQGAK